MVGSRKASSYGAEACRKIISDLKDSGVVIVSGLALGIDGVAHEAALKANLPTIAVLGSGLDWDIVYPRHHVRLAREIIAAGGALVSELPPRLEARPYHFPGRNRIMVGLCQATLIIEAAASSGTLITARLATDYNRDVFAVPGSIFSDQSYGPHSLISSGATPITSGDDVRQAMGIKTFVNEEKRKSLEGLSDLEKIIYKNIDEPISRADLLIKINGDASEINAALSLLEIKGLITESRDKINRV